MYLLGGSRVPHDAAKDKVFFEAMPYSPPKPDRIYRRLQFGRTVDLIVMDQRQYRANQPCDDAIGVPACADYDQPRDFLGRTQMNWVKSQLSASKAAWKVMANEVTVMPTRVLGGAFFGFVVGFAITRLLSWFVSPCRSIRRAPCLAPRVLAGGDAFLLLKAD